ncbi:hypothetical protein GN958_ATG17216 [Phytophthora infestans]|uniref:Uncharacterized protein n=1 Tax=Phytophthora infestans TaxID=4787 RepID=A0A8S9U3Z1_PHYIN|nr:hypothetical protein GN958_ATG17216 [Phytophthora infestans]
MEKPSGVTATTRMRYNLEVSSKQFSVLWMRTQGHIGAEDQDPQLPLGRRTRSMMTATVGQVPRVRSQQRSRAPSQRLKKPVRL